jgi:hypothetical protein
MTLSAAAPANHSSPRLGSNPWPSRVTAIPSATEASSPGSTTQTPSSSRATGSPPAAGRAWRDRGSAERDERPQPLGTRTLGQLEGGARVRRDNGRGTERQRGRDGALVTRVDVERRERQLGARVGQCPRGRREPFALGETAVERGQPLGREPGRRLERLPLLERGARTAGGLTCGGLGRGELVDRGLVARRVRQPAQPRRLVSERPAGLLSGLLAQRQPLCCAPQPVEIRGRLLVARRRTLELLLGPPPLPQQTLELLVVAPALVLGFGATAFELSHARLEPRERGGAEPDAQRLDLVPEPLGALRGCRL